MNNTQTLPTVSIVFPVRSRSLWLPTFLEHIYALDYPKELISIITIVNDSNDDSEQILHKFKQSHESEYNNISISRYDLNSPTYDSNRYAYIAPKIIQSNGVQRMIPENITHTKVYKNLAKLRNSLIHKADTSYIFSIDTDIMFKPDTLKKLLEHNLDYVSAHICNGHMVEKLNGKRAYDYTNAMYYDENTKIHIHYPYETNSGLVKCSNSGAIFLISKKAYKSGSKFEQDKIGEDYPFCQGLIKRGFEIYCDTSIKAAHCMDSDLLEKYKSGQWKY